MSPSKNNLEPTLRERALQTNKSNPSQLGDPISLKAETSSTSPTSEDNGASSSEPKSASQATKENVRKVAPAPTEGGQDGRDGKKTLRQRAMDKLQENPSQLGDPISLKAETADSEPTDNDRGAGGSTSGKSKL
ncbi:hypothetical protein ONS95_008235 [Cadophora gregata]|uniref:uncharacterized protein n=1 Tax=Cadophora gregata TaxID=51156 RepID=UPI0026DD4B2F|nr:uncharacterized protein ONS95_008235 [Cadophora gregata]KAK0100276.1 hypothetical protein ONS96_007558 [Cadophora gregata f. sp. sojae]KAK0126652.1 hypothetical protein ONS95_008235 [Cadophora gregata]